MRRQATIDEIVDAAWELSRANGLGSFSMRELGERVGMRAQSLYSYFSSKNEIYDAMFAQGNRAFIASVQATVDQYRDDGDAATAIERGMRAFFRFCADDPERYQLLFQRTIPDFEPSPESYAIAEEAYELMAEPMRALGMSDADLDLFTAVSVGLVAQQLSNEPGGDRWERLIGRATSMLLNEISPDLMVTTSPRSNS